MEGSAPLRIDIITIFPEYFETLGVSLIGKAVQRGDIILNVHDLRSWTHDPHRTVDDAPFGGGPGMVMRPEPWGEAIDAILATAGGDDRAAGAAGPEAVPQLIVPTPAGGLFDQATA